MNITEKTNIDEQNAILDLIYSISHIKDIDGEDSGNYCFAHEICDIFGVEEDDVIQIAKDNGYNILKLQPVDGLYDGGTIIADKNCKIDNIKAEYNDFYGVDPDIESLKEDLNEDVSLAGTSIEEFDKLAIDNSLNDNYNIKEGVEMGNYYWTAEPEKAYRNRYSGTWKTRIPKNGFKVTRDNYMKILSDPDAIATVEDYFNSHTKSYQCIVTCHQKEIDNSDLNENIEKHDELNPKLWNEDHTLKEEVKEKINQIVDRFIDALKEDEIKIKVKDIRLVGSNCSYNYNDQSDLDVHIIADTDGLECPEKHLSKLYSAYRSIFNKKFDIDFYGIPVEIYVEIE